MCAEFGCEVTNRKQPQADSFIHTHSRKHMMMPVVETHGVVTSVAALKIPESYKLQSDLHRTWSGRGSKPSYRVVNEARIREVKIAERQIILYYCPTTTE